MIYIDLVKHWARMARGSSYWHQPQGVGRAFRPGVLAGYFNDLTAKSVWPGGVDKKGIPIHVIGGKRAYWPTTVLQKGLAHWDLWLLSGCTSEKDRAGFMAAADWTMEAQDARGGWKHPTPLHPQALSDYSCMSQGQGASLLVRVHAVVGEEHYLSAARRGLEIMLTPIEDGGTANLECGGLMLEEFPSVERNTVLNGWIFGIFGLYDYTLAEPSTELGADLDATLRKLELCLARFDHGYWSRYDTRGAISSPFYHDLLIAQHEALCAAFPKRQAAFRTFKERLAIQRSNRLNRYRAMTVKASQKLVRPPHEVPQESILTQ